MNLIKIPLIINGNRYEVVGRNEKELLKNAIGFHERRGLKVDNKLLLSRIKSAVKLSGKKSIVHNDVVFKPGLMGAFNASKALFKEAVHNIVSQIEINRRFNICKKCPLFVDNSGCFG